MRFFSFLLHQKTSRAPRWEAGPFARRTRAWAFVLVGASCGAILLAALNWALFVRRPAPPQAPHIRQLPSFSRETLDAVLAAYAQKRADYENARRAPPAIADPGK